MTSPSFTQQHILVAKAIAYSYGVREEVSDEAATTFLYWQSQQGSSLLDDKVKRYWGMTYHLVD